MVWRNAPADEGNRKKHKPTSKDGKRKIRQKCPTQGMPNKEKTTQNHAKGHRTYLSKNTQEKLKNKRKKERTKNKRQTKIKKKKPWQHGFIKDG